MNEFCNNTIDDIMREMAQWQVDGEISGDEDIDVGGCFYEEAKSEIQNALLKGHFPTNISSSMPIAYNYVASMHRKLTALLYIQSRRINLATDGVDSTRGMWGSIRKKLADISNGEPFGELKSPRHSAQSSCFICGDCSPGLRINRGL